MSFITLGAEGLEGNFFSGGGNFKALAVAVHDDREVGIGHGAGFILLPFVQMSAYHQADACLVQDGHEVVVDVLVAVPSALAGRDVAEDDANRRVLALGALLLSMKLSGMNVGCIAYQIIYPI